MIHLSRPSVVKINENEYITGLTFLNEMVTRFINIKISGKKEREGTGIIMRRMVKNSYEFDTFH